MKNRKRLYILITFISVLFFVSYLSTTFIGIGEIRNLNDAQKREMLERIKQEYEKHPERYEQKELQRKLAEKCLHGKVKKDGFVYYVYLPFLIVAHHESDICEFKDYYFWYFFGYTHISRDWIRVT